MAVQQRLTAPSTASRLPPTSAVHLTRTLTGQPGSCLPSELSDACDSAEQPFVTQEAPRRRLLARLWDFATGQRLERGRPWYSSKGRLLRVAAAASVTAQQVSVASSSTALLRQFDIVALANT